MAVTYIEPERPRCWRLDEIDAAYRAKDMVLISLIEELCPFNDAYILVENLPIEIFPSLDFKIRLKEPDLRGDENLVSESINKELLRVSQNVNKRDWVGHALDMNPISVGHLKWLIGQISYVIWLFNLKHPHEEAKFQRIRQQIEKPFQSVIPSTFSRSFTPPIVDFDHITTPLRELLDKPDPLRKVLQSVKKYLAELGDKS